MGLHVVLRITVVRCLHSIISFQEVLKTRTPSHDKLTCSLAWKSAGYKAWPIQREIGCLAVESVHVH